MTSDSDLQTPQNGSEPRGFEAALGRLELIVRQLEDGDIGLAEALEQYEQGVKLLKECYGLLERAERRIELLCGMKPDGQPITQPFDPSDNLPLEQKAAGRGARRPGAPASKAKSPQRPSAGSELDEPRDLF